MDLPSAAAAALAAAAENDDALAAAHAGPVPTGRLLALPAHDDDAHSAAEEEVFDVDALRPGEQAHELKVRRPTRGRRRRHRARRLVQVPPMARAPLSLDRR